MAHVCSFGVMAILLAETVITLGASFERWCQGQETWVPLTDAINLQPGVVPVVAIGLKSPFFSLPLWDWRFTNRQLMSSGATCSLGEVEEALGEVLGELGGYGSGFVWIY